MVGSKARIAAQAICHGRPHINSRTRRTARRTASKNMAVECDIDIGFDNTMRVRMAASRSELCEVQV